MQLLVNGLIAGSLAALIAGSLALVYGVLGIFNMALGQTVLLGGYITWWLYQVIGLPLSISMMLGLLSGGLIAWVTYIIFVKPVYKLHRFLPIMTTIAMSMIMDGIILLCFKEAPRSILPGIKKPIEWMELIISKEQLYLIIATIMLLLGFAYVFHMTAFGRRLRAVVQHSHAALSLGIPAPALHRLLFIISGFFAAAGGIFIGIDTNLTPTLAFPMTIKAYAAVIAGGRGNIWGAIICAYGIALLEQFAVGIHWFNAFYIPAGYKEAIALVCIIIFLIFKPEGIFTQNSRSA